MKNAFKYFSLAVVAMFFILGVYLLVSPSFNYLPKEVRVIFSVFLFLYGAYRLVRVLTKRKEEEEDQS